MPMRVFIVGVLLLFAPVMPARAQTLQPHAWPIHAALAGYMMLQGADLSITMYDLGRYPQDVREANPAFAPFVSRPALAGAWKMGVAVGTSVALLKLHETHPRLAFVSALAANSIYGWVVWHNTHLLGSVGQ